jgi:hypothetical protein
MTVLIKTIGAHVKGGAIAGGGHFLPSECPTRGGIVICARVSGWRSQP